MRVQLPGNGNECLPAGGSQPQSWSSTKAETIWLLSALDWECFLFFQSANGYLGEGRAGLRVRGSEAARIRALGWRCSQASRGMY